MTLPTHAPHSSRGSIQQSDSYSTTNARPQNAKDFDPSVFEKIEKMEDEFRLKIIIHSVQIDIPQSIKMVVQTSYKEQVQQTGSKCKLSMIQAVKMKDNVEQQTEFKIADFKNQELYLNIKIDSHINYLADHLKKLKTLPAAGNIEQKCSLKLLAVSDDKSKLIGIVNYNFMPRVRLFKPYKRETIQFQKSIDKNASICISTELQPVKVYNQTDYLEMLNQHNTRTKIKRSRRVD